MNQKEIFELLKRTLIQIAERVMPTWMHSREHTYVHDTYVCMYLKNKTRYNKQRNLNDYFNTL